MNGAEQVLLELAKELGPEVVEALAGLLREAIAGKTADELKLHAERIATLTAFKASYRAGVT